MLKSSGFILSGSFQSNPCNILAKLELIIFNPKLYPGHILLPEPNGNSSKFCPFTSIALSKNLSGQNSSGASHIDGSLTIRHVFMNSVVPLRISYPATLQSWRAKCGASKKATGCFLIVSFIIAKYNWVILQYLSFFLWVWSSLKSQPLILINLILAVYLIKWVYLLPFSVFSKLFILSSLLLLLSLPKKNNKKIPSHCLPHSTTKATVGGADEGDIDNSKQKSWKPPWASQGSSNFLFFLIFCLCLDRKSVV